MMEFDAIKEVVRTFEQKKADLAIEDETHEKFYRQQTDHKLRKKAHGELIVFRSNCKRDIEQERNNTLDAIIEYLFRLEDQKDDSGKLDSSYCEKVKWCYLMLGDMDDFCARYFKLPKGWLDLGFIAGVLEDLVVVMRTASQLNISNDHLIPMSRVIDGLHDDQHRFRCLDKLFTLPRGEIDNILTKAITLQGNSKRISKYIDPDGNIFYYAIQGLLGDVNFDQRVIRNLTIENCPLYAVHFTKKEIADDIWNKKTTHSNKTRLNRLPIINGAICKFNRPIHALTNIIYENGYYRIVSVDKDIVDRMTHGIKDTKSRSKYEAGLVISVKKVIETLGGGKVQMNELGTLLVQDDIPHECLLKLISTEYELDIFWHK